MDESKQLLLDNKVMNEHEYSLFEPDEIFEYLELLKMFNTLGIDGQTGRLFHDILQDANADEYDMAENKMCIAFVGKYADKILFKQFLECMLLQYPGYKENVDKLLTYL